jgi:hypothetical protein
MSGEKSKKPTLISGKTGSATTQSYHNTYRNRRIVENSLLIGLDSTIDECNDDCRNIITELRCIVNSTNVFNDVDQCVEFLSQINDEKAFMIVSGALGQQIVPIIHDLPQLNAIYIFLWQQVQT